MDPRAFTPNVRAALVALGLAIVFVQLTGDAQAPAPVVALPYSNGYLVTGNYVTGDVDLSHQSGGGGFQEGTIHMSGVPADAEILSAFLYWETIVSSPSQLNGVSFRGEALDMSDVHLVRSAQASLTGATASCFSSGGGSGATYSMYMMRADVRRLLPRQFDANRKPTGRRLVNDTDLLNNRDLQGNIYGLHTVRLPESGTGNQVPQSAGASLVVIYRDPAEPLRKIVLYDGIAIIPDVAGATMSQTIRGIYQSSATKSAKLTALVGSGQPSDKDRMFFNGTGPGALVATNPFPGGSGASDRSWNNRTFNEDDVTLRGPFKSLLPGAPDAVYGETVTATVDHTAASPYDCLSFAAVIFSTAVADVDRDGNPDGLEDAAGGLRDANDQLLPNLNAMGASSRHQDLFVEMDAMWAPPGTSYGSPAAPFSSKDSLVTLTDTVGHRHMPPAETIKLLIDTYKHAQLAVANADGSPGITPHFDVGNPAPYIAALGPVDGPLYAPYFVQLPHARGGELVQETQCGLDQPPCNFQAFPGTVGWMSDFLGYSNQHFEKVRDGLFHWVFYVHARGKPRDIHPCLDSTGTPSAFVDGVCPAGPPPAGPNPDFHVPSGSSGVGQLPGGKVMVSLGLWDRVNFVGSPELNASTTLHELGHNGGLWHGGAAPIWNETTKLYAYERQCKPNHLSVMSYLFQVSGLLDQNGVQRFDYSRDVYSDVDDTFLSDGYLLPSPPLRYRTAWFSPLSSPLVTILGSSAATRFCSGVKFPSPLPQGWADMARLDGPGIDNQIDWNADGDTGDSGFGQDVNFDGIKSGALAFPATPPLKGFNDWLSLRLDLTGGGKYALGFSAGDDWIGGDDWVGGDDWIGGDDWVGGGELDPAAYGALGHAPPKHLKACVIGTPGCAAASPSMPLHRTFLEWKAPDGPSLVRFHVFRTTGGTVNASSPVLEIGATANGATTTFVDQEELPNGVEFTYFVKAEFTDGTSGASNLATISAINDPPLALADTYSVIQNTTLTVNRVNPDTPVGTVLGNDVDPDSRPATRRVVIPQWAGPSNGTLTLNADGSFTYRPKSGFTGTDSFSYKANDGRWFRDPTVPMSVDSNVTTVTITVNKKK